MTLAVKDFRVWPASGLRAAALMRLPAGPNQRLPSPKDRMSVPCGVTTLRTAVRSEATEAEIRMFQHAAGQAGRILLDCAKLGRDYLDREVIARRHGQAIHQIIDRTLARLGVSTAPVRVREILSEEIWRAPRDDYLPW